MSNRIYAKVCLIGLSLVFLFGTVWASYVNPLTGINFERLYDLKRYLVLGFSLYSAFLLLLVPKPRLWVPTKLTSLVIMLFFFEGGVSAFFSESFYWGGVELANYGVLLILLMQLGGAISCLNRKDILQGVYFTLLIFSVFLFVRFILNLCFYLFDSSDPTIHQLVVGFVNARFMNQVQVFIFPFLLLALISSNLKQYHRITACLIVFHVVILLQTQARGAGLAILFSFTLMVALLGIEARRLLTRTFMKLIVVSILLWLILIVLLPFILVDSVPSLPRTTSSGRVDTWLYAILKIFSDNAFLGYGPMSFVWSEGKPIVNAHLHNSVLQLMYEHGVLVMFLVVGWVSYIIRKEFNALKSKREVNEPQLVAAFSSVLGGLFYSLFSGVIVMPFSQLLLIFSMSLLVSLNNIVESKLGCRWLFVCCCCLVVFLMFSKGVDVESLNVPRIWMDSP